MCSIDLEYCEVWSETKRKARKGHACSCCRGAIQPGEAYIVHFSIFEGDRTSGKLCGPCEVARKEFSDAHDSGTPTPQYFPKLLLECIHDGDEESDARWRPMLDAIDARGATATALSKRGAAPSVGSTEEGTNE